MAAASSVPCLAKDSIPSFKKEALEENFKYPYWLAVMLVWAFYKNFKISYLSKGALFEDSSNNTYIDIKL